VVVEPEVGGPVVAATGWLTGALKKCVVGSLPYRRNVVLVHLDAHHVVIDERQDTTLVVAASALSTSIRLNKRGYYIFN
jgi:hypothetical protein